MWLCVSWPEFEKPSYTQVDKTGGTTLLRRHF